MAVVPNIESMAPAYFEELKDIVLSLVPDVDPKIIYEHWRKTGWRPRIEMKLVMNTLRGGWRGVWRRISHVVLYVGPADILFKLVHEMLPLGDRQLRIFGVGKANSVDPNCSHRLDRRFLENSTLLFCLCSRAIRTWVWIRKLGVGILPVGLATVSDFNLVRLLIPNGLATPTVDWLVGNYLNLAYPILIKRSPVLNLGEMKRNLEYLYDLHQRGKRFPLLPLFGCLILLHSCVPVFNRNFF